jgi:hypothetical protein
MTSLPIGAADAPCRNADRLFNARGIHFFRTGITSDSAGDPFVRAGVPVVSAIKTCGLSDARCGSSIRSTVMIDDPFDFVTLPCGLDGIF